MNPKKSFMPFTAALLSLACASVLFCANAALAQIFQPLRLDLIEIEGAGLQPAVIDANMDFWAELDGDGNVYTDWGKYSRADNFTYYKIVRSQENDNPVYPQDGYVYYTENINELSWTDTAVPYGTSWYRICHVADPKVYCSGEVYKIIRPMPLKTGALAEITGIRPDLIDPSVLETSDPPQIRPDLWPELADSGAGAEVDGAGDGAGAGAGEASGNGGMSGIESFISEYWVQFLAMLLSLLGVSLAVTGFTIAGAKKKKSVSKFLHQIDDTFAEFKWKSKRCEAELYRLHDLVDDQLKAGKLDEGTYQLLHGRIDRYLAEIKEIDNLPPHLKEKI